MDDLDFEVRVVTFEAKVFNRYGTFDRIANKSMKDLSYANLHCVVLNMVALTIILFRVKLSHIDMHEWYLQKGMFVKVKFFGIESKSKRGFEQGDMHVVITIELMTIMSPIIAFELEFVPMSFHMDSIGEFKRSSNIIALIVVGVRGRRNNKGEKQLLIVDEDGEFH